MTQRKRPPAEVLNRMNPERPTLPDAVKGRNFATYSPPMKLPAKQDAATAYPMPTSVDAKPITIDSGRGSFGSVQGTPENHAYALLIRFGAVLVVEMIALALIALGIWISAWATGQTVSVGWLFLTSVAGLATFYLMDKSDKEHSPIGAERHRVDAAENVAIETTAIQVGAWQYVETRRWELHYGAIERQSERDHKERIRAIEQHRSGLISD